MVVGHDEAVWAHEGAGATGFKPDGGTLRQWSCRHDATHFGRKSVGALTAAKFNIAQKLLPTGRQDVEEQQKKRRMPNRREPPSTLAQQAEQGEIA